MTKIYDLSDPTKPVFIRDFGLPGSSQDRRGSRPLTTDCTVRFPPGPKGNRVYFAYRLRAGRRRPDRRSREAPEGTEGADPDNLLYPQISRMDLPPNVGAHNVFPLLGMPIAEFAKQPDNLRDFLPVVDEAHGRECSDGAEGDGLYLRHHHRIEAVRRRRAGRCPSRAATTAAGAPDASGRIPRTRTSRRSITTG